MLTEAAAGAGVQYVFGLNNLYDPDVTGAGHQPMYYDQLFTQQGLTSGGLLPTVMLR
jgi:hypothetical protein